MCHTYMYIHYHVTDPHSLCRLKNIKRKLQIAVIVTAVIVEIIYFIKGVLLVYRYLLPSKVCVNHTIKLAESQIMPEDDDSLGLDKDDHGYNYTVFVYGITSILRLVEYLPLFVGLWKYWNETNRNQPHDNLQCKHYFKWFMLLTPVWAISLSIPVVGVLLEKHCGDAKVTAKVFIVYCSVNFLRYTWAFSVRMGMVFATLKVKEIWKNVPAGIQNANEDNPMSLHTSLTDIYTNAGEQVKKIAKIFETWFLFPWIIFFLVSSLKAKNILSLWNEDEDKVEFLPLMYLMLYNINQMIFLIIPYLCAKKMNHYHHQCIMSIQKEQLNTEKGAEFVAEQRKLLIQMDENYNVVPRLWGLGLKVKMNSFIYIIFLVMGLIFTIFTPLF